MNNILAVETLSVERLREVLDYDPETGVFTWKFRPEARKEWNTRYAGKEAGSVSRYLNIRIGTITHQAHRLAWLHVYGIWPKDQIDHKDGDKLNNRLENLREVTNRVNDLNRALACNNTSGVSGAWWWETKGRWQARVHYLGKYHWLGLFTSLAEAEAAIIAKRKEFGFSPTHGMTREQRARLGPEAVAA